jgi:hypothetical protein
MPVARAQVTDVTTTPNPPDGSFEGRQLNGG